MPLTLLQIVNACQGELGLPQSSTVAGNTDATTVQLYNLANRVLDDLRRENTWTVLQREFDIVVNTPVITTGNVANNSPVITNIPSTAGLLAQYFAVSSNVVPPAARVISVDSPTQVTMSMEATGTVANTAITFSQDTYALPSDIDFYVNQTMWDRTNHWRLFGPDSPQTDELLRSGIVPTTPRRHWRQLGPFSDRFRLWPPPAELVNPIQLVLEYISNSAVAVHGSLSSFSQTFTNDDDQPLLDSQAVVLGLKWQFFETKGFNFASMQQRFVDYVEKLKARDGGAKTLPLVRRPSAYLLTSQSVQDGNWPSAPSTAGGT